MAKLNSAYCKYEKSTSRGRLMIISCPASLLSYDVLMRLANQNGTFARPLYVSVMRGDYIFILFLNLLHFILFLHNFMKVEWKLMCSLEVNEKIPC